MHTTYMNNGKIHPERDGKKDSNNFTVSSFTLLLLCIPRFVLCWIRAYVPL